jgi:hypothetical protein
MDASLERRGCIFHFGSPPKRPWEGNLTGISVKELIEGLRKFACRYGNDTEVVLVKGKDNEASPTISGGPDKTGIVKIRIL